MPAETREKWKCKNNNQRAAYFDFWQYNSLQPHAETEIIRGEWGDGKLENETSGSTENDFIIVWFIWVTALISDIIIIVKHKSNSEVQSNS